jgi:hypothetical protein
MRGEVMKVFPGVVYAKDPKMIVKVIIWAVFFALVGFLGYTILSGFTIADKNPTIAALQDSLAQQKLNPFNEADKTSWILVKRTYGRLCYSHMGKDSVIITSIPLSLDTTFSVTFHNVMGLYGESSYDFKRQPPARGNNPRTSSPGQNSF